MAQAKNMRLVFRLDGIGFCLPISHVVEIKDSQSIWLDDQAIEPRPGSLGQVPFRGGTIHLFDLRQIFELSPRKAVERLTVLVLHGLEGYWGAVVDGIEGIFPDNEFAGHDLPSVLHSARNSFYRSVDLWHGEPLVSCDAGHLEDLWSGV